MILTLIAISIFVIGIILIIINTIADRNCDNKVWRAIYYNFDSEVWGIFLAVIGGFFLVIFSAVIIGAHVGVDNTIRQDNIRYESLCKRLEIINSDYEDVSKSEVINDIAEWNTDVTDNQYWAKNPWTNWFHSQKRVDNLKLIEY